MITTSDQTTAPTFAVRYVELDAGVRGRHRASTMTGPVESDEMEIPKFRNEWLVGIRSAPQTVNEENGSTSFVALTLVEKPNRVAKYIPRGREL